MMSRFVLGNLYLMLSLIGAAGGHILLKAVIDDVKSVGVNREMLRMLFTGERLARGGMGALLIGAAFVFWLLALTKLDLSYAYPIACSSVLLVTIFSAIFLGEPVTARTYLASVLILAGVILLMPSK